MFAKLLRGGITALTLVCVAPQAHSQTGSGVPPTYDYNASIPGVQGPNFLQNSSYDYRSVRTYQVSIPVYVPVRELQALMPPGFSAIASPAGSETALLTLAMFADQRFEIVANQRTYGPVSALLVSTTALNSNVSPARQELVFPSFQASGETAALDIAFGPGSSRAASVGVTTIHDSYNAEFQFDIADATLGLKLKVEVVAPPTLNTRSVSDPVGLPFRTFTGLVPNRAFRAASQSDVALVPSSVAIRKFRAAGQRLNFPAGSVSVVGFGENVTFSRNVEFVVKYEQ